MIVNGGLPEVCPLCGEPLTEGTTDATECVIYCEHCGWHVDIPSERVWDFTGWGCEPDAWWCGVDND